MLNKLVTTDNPNWGKTKTVFLLAQLDDDTHIWLEEPRWDCGWYWGFGYIEQYTIDMRPDRSRDITSHSHWDGMTGKGRDYYDLDKQVWHQHSEYRHHLNEFHGIKDTVLTDKESWYLSDLMQRFYNLKETAELLHSGTAHLTSQGIQTKNDEFLTWINTIALPDIFREIGMILTPMDMDKFTPIDGHQCGICGSDDIGAVFNPLGHFDPNTMKFDKDPVLMKCYSCDSEWDCSD